MKQRPGPIGLSCLTCRHRRKKCDKARPACRRCTVGGFSCLGYDCLDKGSASPSIDESPKDSDNESKIQISHASQSSCNLFTASASSDTVTREYTFVSTPGISGVVSKSPSEYLKIATAPSPSNEGSSTDRSSRFVSFVPGSQSPWQTQASSPIDSADTSSSVVFYNPTVGFYNSFGDRSPTLDAQRPWGMSDSLHISVPHNLSPIPSNIRPVIDFILSQYERLIALSYVKLSHEELSRFREYGMWELQMPTVRAPMLLGCKIFESVIDGTGKQKLGYYNRCIAKLEQQLHSSSSSSMTTAETYGQLSGTLQITFLKLMFAVGVNAYQLLRNAAPAVIQIAFTDSSLWPSSSDFISLSLAHALASTHYELGRFILLDSIYSMIYVLPQVIEYDTSTPPLPTLLTPVEWVHGCPVELQFALVEINQYCHSLHRLGPEPDWRAIEHRIKSWNPKVHSGIDTEPWKSAARLAVQESWRHTLLIYLYMAVGGLASNNAQVYASVQQVFKLVGVVKHFEIPSMDTHFLVQYVIAGACTPKENQRAKARERLLATFDLSGVWVLRGSEFVPVLDHIWHGAAADGRPIWWSDYVHSRQVMLPIAM